MKRIQDQFNTNSAFEQTRAQRVARLLRACVHMRQNFLPSLILMLVGFGSAYAQNPSQRTPPEQQRQQPQGEQQENDSQTATLVGCLTKGAAAGEYVIAVKSSGEKVAFTASEKIEPYVNQTVQLTGKMADRGGSKVFQPESVKRVATTCEEK